MRTSRTSAAALARGAAPSALALGAIIASLSAGDAAARVAPAIPTPTPTPVATVQSMKASWHGTSWSVPIDLGGRAEKNATVRATSPCAIGTCTAQTTANAKGRWKVRFDAILKPGQATLDVTLASGQNKLVRTFKIVKPTVAKPGAGTVMVIGDSLAVGTAGLLPPLLSDRPVTTQAAVGRSLSRGLAIFANTPLDASIRVAVFSLFTNDDPSTVSALTKGVRATMTRLGAGRCAVWFTIRRPAVDKVSYRAANDALTTLAADPAYGGRLIVIPWSATVDEDHAILSKDRVHPTAAGYQQRAQLMADAVRSCPNAS
ncbi:MAG: SGNH/GDSL hydrolase family protein [Solirubrobacteraceae bacterium]|nr:SGNH/GDSL hydrolase family protein [Solirubrobacteraceae bacterium]